MIKVLHNPRCTKSRQALSYLADKSIKHEERLYLKEPLSKEELQEVLKALSLDNPMDLLRTKETDFKENFKGKNLNEAQVIDAILQFPKIMERPVIINDNKAVIGRPTEKIDEVV